MIRPFYWPLLLLIFSAVSNSAEAADANSGAEMYSHGVHGYFSGNLNRADMYLYRAVELNPNDPRPYYFRGLVLMRLGRTWEAQEVIQLGATIEAGANASAYGIGEALQRVQGADRLRLEQIRRDAKLNQTNSAVENSRRRYEVRERIQATVQRRPVRLTLEAFVNPVEPKQLAGLAVLEEPLPEVTPPTDAPTVQAAAAAPQEFVATDEGDPFADDPIAPTSPPPSAQADVPEPVAGSVKAGSLPGIFGRILGRQLPTVDVDRLRGMVPSVGGGPAPPVLPQDSESDVPPAGDPFGEPVMPPESGF